jgi:hypothetical protein
MPSMAGQGRESVTAKNSVFQPEHEGRSKQTGLTLVFIYRFKMVRELLSHFRKW